MFNKPPLSPELVETLFARLVLTWGRPFRQMYEGIDPAIVQADWADKLRGYQLDPEIGDRPEDARAPAIDWALDYLPGTPLNAVQFRQLCGRYTAGPGKPALPAPPRPVPAQFRQVLAKLAEPIDDKRPERVRWAQRYIDTWGNDPRPPHRALAHLVDARRILERYEEQQRRDKEREEQFRQQETSHAG
jgi:hypothetical protein